jgi:hypothetical protein
MQAQETDLDRVVGGHEERQLRLDAERVMLEPGDPLAMPDAERLPARTGQRSWRPQLTAVFVPQIERLPGRIRDRIVRPRGQPICLAVPLPGEAGA